ncbi:MAG: hypothetical protein U1F55_03580 [Chitinivorax sp.]
MRKDGRAGRGKLILGDKSVLKAGLMIVLGMAARLAKRHGSPPLGWCASAAPGDGIGAAFYCAIAR